MSASYVFSAVIFLHAAFEFSARHIAHTSEETRWLLEENPRQLRNNSCRTGNPIDECWRCDPQWDLNRKALADCAVGFGRSAVGGRDGQLYTVNTSEDGDPMNPVPGTLRHAVIQEDPLWIIFDRDMVIQLKHELVISSYKTLDGRGSRIQVSDGPCITIHNATNIIIHGIDIQGCVPAERDSLLQLEPYYSSGISDGDAISIIGSKDVWIDHCTLANCYDGLIDVTHGSTSITISNNYMTNHNEVMLLGHDDDFLADKNMQVTIAFNYFGENLVQRMPRCRHGYFHIVNNIYTGWKMYAIGGSADPTINSQGNIFAALDNDSSKEVTKRETQIGYSEWKAWNWRSDGDLMQNGAFFTSSGQETPASYTKASSMVARPASIIKDTPPSAGVLNCQTGQQC